MFFKLRKIIIMIVANTKNKFVLKPKFDEAKTLGIIRKIINGLVTPPVKYNKKESWIKLYSGNSQTRWWKSKC